MGIQSTVSHIERHARLFERMMVKLGVREEMAAMKDVETAASKRCLGCAAADACGSWLDEDTEAPRAPSYCRNAALFDRLMEAVPNESE
ncbi:MAG: DUF6455 family protein [Pseudomonadota bacterium]